jgi:hypothetical protein
MALRAHILAVAIALAVAAPAAATESPSLYNDTMPGQTHGGPGDNTPTTITSDEVSQCIAPQPARTITAWLLGGTSSGYRFDGLDWRDTCFDGQVRVQRLPSVRVNVSGQQREMYFQRGGAGSAPFGSDPLTRDQAIRHAHIWVSDLTARPTTFSMSDPAIHPNGRACTATTNLYRTDPKPIPGYYKSLSQVQAQGGTSNAGANWGNYGNPSETEGTQHSGVRFNYLLWNWRWDNNSGGGQVRVSMEANTPVRRCDVAEVTSNMYALNSDEVIGQVKGMYGYVRDAAGEAHHGWVVHSYKRNTDANWTNLLTLPSRCCLAENDRLRTDESLYSDNGQYRLTVQLDGNLVLYGPSGAVWWTGTACFNCGTYLIMQSDGNLVLYTGSGQVLWATNRFGSGARFVVQNDGNLIVYSGTNSVIWRRF